MEIGEQLKTCRLESKLTQEMVASQIFVSTKSISNWENGRNFPDIESLIRLAKIYNLSLDSLLLEGSSLVEDIKRKEQITKLHLFYFFGPILTGSLLLILIYLMPEKTERWVKSIVFLAGMTNIVTGFYFKNKIAALKGKEVKTLKELIRLRRIILAFFICLIVFIVYLLTL